MIRLFNCLFFLLIGGAILAQPTDYGATYIEAWKKFYPSKAVDQGIHSAVFNYEDLSQNAIQEWIDFNKKTIATLSDTAMHYLQMQATDSRLLKLQAQKELEKWEVEAIHRHSLPLYSQLIVKSLEKILTADFLTTADKKNIVCQRLKAIKELSDAAQKNLKEGSRKDIEKGLRTLSEARAFYTKLPTQIKGNCVDFIQQISVAIKAIESLIEYVEQELLPTAKETQAILGRTAYARKLALYTDSQLTPEKLSQIALEEIQTVKKLIGTRSLAYFKKQYPNKSIPEKEADIIQIAFTDMERDAPKDGADYLAFWQDLSAAAIRFIEEKEIATLPKFQTLQITPAPDEAGPAARIGWVDSAPPFAPNPLTILYLPSIPDTFPEKEKTEFWASFNKPFNRMIVIHELFPGHYMQIKISRETAHPVRLLFPYALYFEGWATFTERVCLDEGWEKENPLTFLAHLRKRLENANRAYTSVQVHCNDWTSEQVLDFSTKTSLLAPQFAKSLWGRIMRSPMQLTSYFLGGQQFGDLLEQEKQRQGDSFVLKDFMDTIMKTGAIPIDEFSAVFNNN